MNTLPAVPDTTGGEVTGRIEVLNGELVTRLRPVQTQDATYRLVPAAPKPPVAVPEWLVDGRAVIWLGVGTVTATAFATVVVLVLAVLAAFGSVTGWTVTYGVTVLLITVPIVIVAFAAAALCFGGRR